MSAAAYHLLLGCITRTIEGGPTRGTSEVDVAAKQIRIL